MSDKIGYSDTFDDNLFDPLIKGLEKVYAGFDKMGQKATENLLPLKEYFSTFKAQTATSADIKEFNAALTQQSKAVTDLNTANKAKLATTKEIEKVEQERQKTQQQSIKTEIEYQKLQKISNTERKKSLDAYQKESKALNDLRNKYKAVAAEQGINSKAAQDLLRKLEPLDKKLKGIDASAGQFQRNVGNYSSAFNKFGSSINNILGAAGISLGVGGFVNLAKSIFNTRAEFQKFEAVLTNTLGSQSQAQAALTNISEFASKTPFGVAEVTESFVKLANRGFKPTNAELTKLGDLAASQGKSFGQLTEAVLDAQTGEFVRLKEFGIKATQANGKVTLSFKDQTVVVNKNDEAIRNAILGFGDLQGVVGGMAAISDTLGGKLSNLNDNFDALLNTMGESSEGVFSALLDGLNTLLSGLNDVDKVISEINRNLKSEGVELGFFDKLFNATAIANVELNSYINAVKTASESHKNYNKGIDILKQNQGILFDQYKKGIIDLDVYEAKSALVRKGIKDLTDSSAAYTKELGNQLNKTKDLSKEEKKLAEQRAKADDEKKLRIQIENMQDQSILTNQVRDEALAKREYERKKKEIEESKASQKTKNEALLQLELEYYNKKADIENKYIDEKEKKEKDEKAKAKKENDEAFNEAWEEALRLQKIEDEARDEKSKKYKEAKEKQRKEAFDAANQLLEIAEKRINQEQDLINDAIDSEISKRQSAVDEQKRRAEQGLSSDIATAEKNLKDAEARKKDIEKEAIKRQQALTFFKLLSANAESDPNNALTKTFTEMLLSEALVKSLPGFFKGTENVERDLKGNKVHNGRDGHVIAVDGGERVMTGDQNKLMGGMANDDVANLVYRHNNNLLPNYMISEPLSPMGVAENMYNSIQLQQLLKQNEELIRAVKSIPGTNIMFSDGKMKRTDNVNGFKTTTIKPFNRAF